MKSIGAYILLELSASPCSLPVAQVWQGVCDSVLGVLSREGMRVSVIGYSNAASVLLEGVAPGEALSWTPPREELGMTNLNLALLQCLTLLKRAPSGETPFILLASGGLITDEPDLLSRRWSRMTDGIPKYALLTGRSAPGIPFPAFSAPASSVYRPDGRDLDRLARDLQEDLGADSLDVVDLLMSIEDEFEVEVPDEEIENIKTVGALVSYIEANS